MTVYICSCSSQCLLIPASLSPSVSVSQHEACVVDKHAAPPETTLAIHVIKQAAIPHSGTIFPAPPLWLPYTEGECTSITEAIVGEEHFTDTCLSQQLTAKSLCHTDTFSQPRTHSHFSTTASGSLSDRANARSEA